jgi:hypothetical protein
LFMLEGFRVNLDLLCEYGKCAADRVSLALPLIARE